MAKQSARDRALRLSQGCCPIHGTPMTQIGNDEIDGQHVYVVACPRNDCDVQATQVDAGGAAVLDPAWAHLVGPVLVGCDIHVVN